MGTTIYQKLEKHSRIVIIQDSIFNSVFHSQVITPLQLYAEKNPKHHIVIISFEKQSIPYEKQVEYIPKSFTFIQLTKKPFMGLWSLSYSISALKKTLSSFARYTIMARGPIAGYVAVRAQTQNCQQITIQARGLLAEEYGYTNNNNQNLLFKLWHKARQKLYYILERKTYSLATENVTFEAVSPALKKYLIDTYNTFPHNITIAHNDIPPSFSHEKKALWHKKIRQKLNINKDTYVYCYNGSAKSWQCPHDILEFFAEKLRKNPKVVLLILSQDTEIFLTLLQQYHISDRYYRVVHVSHDQIFWYLAAADAGLLFREPHIINWISRPTKVLEYRAMQLKIIHNDTVAYLVDEPRHTFSLQQESCDHC